MKSHQTGRQDVFDLGYSLACCRCLDQVSPLHGRAAKVVSSGMRAGCLRPPITCSVSISCFFDQIWQLPPGLADSRLGIRRNLCLEGQRDQLQRGRSMLPWGCLSAGRAVSMVTADVFAAASRPFRATASSLEVETRSGSSGRSHHIPLRPTRPTTTSAGSRGLLLGLRLLPSETES